MAGLLRLAGTFLPEYPLESSIVIMREGLDPPLEPLPTDVAARIESGTPPIIAVRLWRRLTIQQLAERTGIDATLIETAERSGEMDASVRARLAHALRVHEDILLE